MPGPRYAPSTTHEASPRLSALVGHALAYHRDVVAPHRRYRAPTDQERAAMEELHAWLGGPGRDASAEAIQFELYEIGKRHAFANLRDWFKGLYEVLLGQSEGPRFGTFVAIFGTAETRRLIEGGLARAAAAA